MFDKPSIIAIINAERRDMDIELNRFLDGVLAGIVFGIFPLIFLVASDIYYASEIKNKKAPRFLVAMVMSNPLTGRLYSSFFKIKTLSKIFKITAYILIPGLIILINVLLWLYTTAYSYEGIILNSIGFILSFLLVCLLPHYLLKRYLNQLPERRITDKLWWE